jgi:Tfp pilus assembly protein PilF
MRHAIVGSMRAFTVAVTVVLLTGCAMSARSDWEDYTRKGIDSVRSAQYRQAERYLHRALVKAEELGPREQGISLNSLGELYRRQRRHEDAERMFTRALQIKEAGLGPNHPDVATTLTNLGLVYLAEGRDQAAAPLLERALAIQESKLSAKNPAIGRTLAALAEVYRHLGREVEAGPLEERARVFREREGADR